MISASGIYRTIDGTTWEHLKEFRDENLPMAVTNQGIIFVGPYRSLNHGETFESYIKWEKIIQKIAKSTKYYPKHIRLHEILPLDHFGKRVAIKIDWGQKAKFALTEDHGLNWSLISSEALTSTAQTPAPSSAQKQLALHLSPDL
jgi:hypothetical protein